MDSTPIQLRKRIIIFLFGIISWPRFKWSFNTHIEGAENLKHLPKRGVLFVGNHQTYFAETALMYHVIIASKWRRYNKLPAPYMMLFPKINIFFVAAMETMKSGLLPRLFRLAGGILVKRTWRAKGENVKRKVDLNDTYKIGDALERGWVINFPQGTTKPFVKGRKGVAHIIKQYHPIVVPIVVDGFRRSFDKKGLFFKKKGLDLYLTVKAPIHIDYEGNVEDVLKDVMYEIEQSEEFDQVGNLESTKELEKKGDQKSKRSWY
jgi:1-acyl-sn-glycerol-3-phosphate acyltransferase